MDQSNAEPSSRLSNSAFTTDRDGIPGVGALSTIADSIRRCATGMGAWGMQELTVGLIKLAARHACEGAVDTICGSPVTEVQELEEMLHWLRWAKAAYEKDRSSVIEFLQLQETQLKKYSGTAAVLRPAYFIAVDDAKSCVVISIRGTRAAPDILTDLKPHSEKFGGGYAHSGMLEAAVWILKNEIGTIQDLLRLNPGYGLVLVGHSLGAGTASLLSMLLQRFCDPDNSDSSFVLQICPLLIKCWGFGCPPCVDICLAQQGSFIKNIVLQDDIVARACPAAIEDLRLEVLRTGWAQIPMNIGSKTRKMLELAQATSSSVRQVESAFGYEQGHFYKQAKTYVSSWKVAGLISRGVTAISELTAPIDNQKAKAFQVTASPSFMDHSSSEALVMGRLFVPGILYHVTRKPLQDSHDHPDNDMVDEHQQKDITNDQERMPNLEVSKPQKRVKHTVIRGDDPKSRFKKIVLSTCMFSDHTLRYYKDAIEDAAHWVRSGASIL
eukprot:c17117_g1_i1 orf=177-1667(-)